MYDNNIIYNTVYRKSNTKGVYLVFRILLVYTIYDVWLFSRETSVPRSIYYYYTTAQGPVFRVPHGRTFVDGRAWNRFSGRSAQRSQIRSVGPPFLFSSRKRPPQTVETHSKHSMHCNIKIRVWLWVPTLYYIIIIPTPRGAYYGN